MFEWLKRKAADRQEANILATLQRLIRVSNEAYTTIEQFGDSSIQQKRDIHRLQETLRLDLIGPIPLAEVKTRLLEPALAAPGVSEGARMAVEHVCDREAGDSQPQVGIRRKIHDTQWHGSLRSTVKFEFSSPDEEAVFRRAIAEVDGIVDLPSWLRDISDDDLVDLLRNGPLRTLEEMRDWELARREWIRRNGIYVELFRVMSSEGNVTSLDRIARVGDDMQRIKVHTRRTDAESITNG